MVHLDLATPIRVEALQTSFLGFALGRSKTTWPLWRGSKRGLRALQTRNSLSDCCCSSANADHEIIDLIARCKSFHRILRALFNKKVVDAASFDELILSKISLQHQLDKERTEAAQEIGRLQTTIRTDDARVQWLIASFQEQARHQQGLSFSCPKDGGTISGGQGKRPSARREADRDRCANGNLSATAIDGVGRLGDCARKI